MPTDETTYPRARIAPKGNILLARSDLEICDLSTVLDTAMFMSPKLIAKSLHDRAEKGEPQVAVDPHLPETVRARFQQKVFLYREVIILLALLDRIRPPGDGGSADPQFKAIFSEYEGIICAESADSPSGAAKRQSVKAAVEDLNALLHRQWGNRYDVARDWGEKWFADIGHHEMNPEIVSRFSTFWFDEYSTVQNILEAAAQNGELDDLNRALESTIGLP